jgi:peptidoglycan hydrolase-like protein with peptidoglycan-binding domain
VDRNVKEIQGYLGFISKHNEHISPVVPDGIMGEETKDSVKEFQAEYDLPVSGEVNPKTWDRIVEVYKDFKGEDENSLKMFKRGIITGENKKLLETMLVHITGKFSSLPENPELAIKKIQKVSGLPESGKVDVKTWNRILTLYNISCH